MPAKSKSLDYPIGLLTWTAGELEQQTEKSPDDARRLAELRRAIDILVRSKPETR